MAASCAPGEYTLNFAVQLLNTAVVDGMDRSALPCAAFPRMACMVRYDMVRYDMVRYDMVRYDVVRYDMVRHGTVWYGTIQDGIIWWDGMGRYDVV